MSKGNSTPEKEAQYKYMLGAALQAGMAFSLMEEKPWMRLWRPSVSWKVWFSQYLIYCMDTQTAIHDTLTRLPSIQLWQGAVFNVAGKVSVKYRGFIE